MQSATTIDRLDTTTRRTCLAAWGCLAALVATGCDLPLVTVSETTSEVFPITSPTPTIVVETFNGSIDISNGPADEVVAEVTRRAGGIDHASAAANLEGIELDLSRQENSIHISAKRVSRMAGNSGASIVISAPPGSKLKLVSSNGSVVCEGMIGGINARTSNAGVRVYEGQGDIEARTSNGAIDIQAQQAHLDARTSNAHIRFEGTLADAVNELKTSNGGIDVLLPNDSKFRYKAQTSNGRIDCDFETTSGGGSGEGSSRREEGTVGSDAPDCLLKLNTSNASIDITPKGSK